jgi:hypothetical protein
MNVEIGAEAALFPEKEYISGIFVAVHNTTIDPYGIEGPISKTKMEVEAKASVYRGGGGNSYIIHTKRV